MVVDTLDLLMVHDVIYQSFLHFFFTVSPSRFIYELFVTRTHHIHN